MGYSVKTILHPYADKEKLHKILIQVIYNRMKVYVPTIFKVPENNFETGTVVKHKHKKHFNDEIGEKKNNIEKKLLDAIREDRLHTKGDLVDLLKGNVNKNLVSEYIHGLTDKLKGKLSEGRLKHYSVVANKIDAFIPKCTFGNISVKWMNNFEAWLRSHQEKGVTVTLDGNTVLSNMSLLIGIFNKAKAENLIKESQFKLYKRPSYNQKLIEYLTETELLKIKAGADATDKQAHKRAAYYFLLSAFTGYRISDSKRFDYDEMVKDGKVVLRAKKNGEIVSIPIYPQLQQIIDFVKDNPLDLSEDKTRQYVKEICDFVGIKKHVKFHTSRHSFALFLLSKGFTIDEVAVCLGDSPEVARVYARISNEHLENKFRDRLG